jgi:hypothetical protein
VNSYTEKLLDKLRCDGWSVAVHNDYYLAGDRHTFWLFTRADHRWIKGEGRSDEAALMAAEEQARAFSASPPSTDGPVKP